MGQIAAFDADGVHFGHVLGYGHELWHGAEWYAFEVHVESGYNDAFTTVGQFVAYLDNGIVEELCLVDAYHLCVGGHEQYAAGRLDGGGGYGIGIVRHDVVVGIAGVDSRLVDFDTLAGYAGTLQAAYEFLGFAREHGTAYYLNVPLLLGENVMLLLKHGGNLG